MAITFLAAAHVFAQPAPVVPLDRRVVANVDLVYPGFTEILQSRDSVALAKLARTLSANPSEDSLAVLLWMLRYCPPWGTDSSPSEPQIAGVARAVGRLPLAPISEALLNGDVDQRIVAAVVLGRSVDLIPAEEKASLQTTLITALADPNIRVREFVAGPLRGLGTAEGDAALARALEDPNVTEAFYWQAARRTRPTVPQSTPPSDAKTPIATLIERLRDPNIEVRTHAAQALGNARASNAIGALASSLDGRDVTRRYQSTVIAAFTSIGSREALPVLERLARTAGTQRNRNAAATAFVAIAKPANPAREVRRLLWEQPDTDLERDVLARGRRALPAVWKALAAGSERERRAATALLAWFPDVQSIRPILAALEASPGALTREQLLFDLNMILLAQGTAPGAEDRRALAAQHLQWLYDQLANQPIDSDIRSIVLRAGPTEAGRDTLQTIAVYPDRVSAPFAVDLSTVATGTVRQESGRRFSARAVLSESRQAFLESVAKESCGVAFHAITAADGVARVATTLYLPRGRIANQVWISLYRHEGGRWIPLPVPSHPVLHEMPNEPNLLPTINRDYGGDHPLKILRLDLTMERIRVELAANRYFHSENIDVPGHAAGIDASYARLFDKYRRSGVPSVKYTAELESVRLTGRTDVQLWIDALAEHAGTPIQEMARRVIADYVVPQLGAELEPGERDPLVAAAIDPRPVDARLLPKPLPRAENVVQVQRSKRFGLVTVAFGPDPRGTSGYSMLFERRGDRWVFLCVVKQWIA